MRFGILQDNIGQYLTGALSAIYYVHKFLQINKEQESMGATIEYQKLMTEIVHINLPGPAEPTPGMSGGELLHGFLADIYRSNSQEVKNYINSLCLKWNVHYRENKG